jgi:uncharacterized membrane protein YgdD (TMEM256/DUF423 family)
MNKSYIHRLFFKAATITGLTGVVLGAFGTHLFKPLLLPETFSGFQTASYYQLFHALALLCAGIMYRHYKNKKMQLSGYFFIVGVVLFSGSIYARVFMELLELEKPFVLALITPVGGVFFMLGWLYMFLSVPASLQTERDSE